MVRLLMARRPPMKSMSLLRPLLLSVVIAMMTILLGLIALSFFSSSNLIADGAWATPHAAGVLLSDMFPSFSQLGLVSGLVVAAGLLWGAFAFGFVRWIKSHVLRELTEQVRRMHAVLKRPDAAPIAAAPVPGPKPDVAEFDELVTTIRETHARLLTSRAEQNARIEALTTALNQDPLTRLVSRSYFMNALRASLAPNRESRSGVGEEVEVEGMREHDTGHVLICRQRDLAALNQLMPRHLTDQWLRTTALRLNAIFSDSKDASALLGRLNGSDFAVLLPGVSEAQAGGLAEQVRAVLRETRLPLSDGSLCRWAISLVRYRRGDTMTDVLAQLDHALMRSESKGKDSVAIGARAAQAVAPGEYAWKDTIDSALEDHRFFLTALPLALSDGTILRHEATLMLQHEAGSAALPPSLFIPAAVRLDMSVACDIQAIRLGLDWLVSNRGDLTVRICTPTLARAAFIPRLLDMLATRQALASRLVIEIDAHAIVTNLAGAISLGETLHAHGARLGARRLAQQLTALESLHLLRLAYVRIDGPFLKNLAESPGSRHLAASIASTARDCDIAVYADDVVGTKVNDILSALGILPVHKPSAAPPAFSALHEARA